MSHPHNRTVDQSTSLSKTANPSAADILSRPRLPKKKQHHSNKKSIKNSAKDEKPTTNQIKEGDDNQVDQDELIDQLLNQTADINLLSSLSDKPQQATHQINTNQSSRRSSTISRKIHDLGEDLKEVAHAVTSSINTSTPVNLINSKRKNNRQKEKIAKRQAAQLQAQLDAQLELSNNSVVDRRKLEADGFIQTCKSMNLQMVDIIPDGHCLYSAIADQLNLKDPSTGPYDYQKCRKLASDYMRDNPNEFIHYLPGRDNDLEDGLMNETEYQRYCDDVRDSARWGGEPEILALSKSLRFSIHVIQAFQPIIKISHDEFYEFRGNVALMVSYHRKSYGLGEHYNSLRPIAFTYLP